MTNQTLPYAALILKLLQGVIYYEDKQWDRLLSYAAPIQAHFAAIGLHLHIDEVEGYAYLTQPEHEDDELNLPRLLRRMPLTYDATLLCVLLRESLQQFDAQTIGETRHVLSRSDLYGMLQLFFPQQPDMVRLEKRFDTAIRQVEQLSFIKKLRQGGEDQFEIRRIIKAKIDADTLVLIKAQLQAHVAATQTNDTDEENSDS